MNGRPDPDDTYEEPEQDNHPAVVQHTRDHRGMKTSLCPVCGTQFIYWDDDDLDENGDLLCYGVTP